MTAAARSTLVVGLVMIVLVAACSSGSPSLSPASTPGPSGGVPSIAWQQVVLPSGTSVVTLAAAGDELLVGGYGAGPVRPRLDVVRGTARVRSVVLVPRSGYAPLARWKALAVQGGTVLAIGGAPGGAHSNTRWTVWRGTDQRLIENPQTFDTFGGWGAGGLVGLAAAGGRPLIAGAWQSVDTGLDVAVWSSSGDRWTRSPSAGTPLQSTRSALAAVTGATTAADGAVLVGSLTRLGSGSITVTPAVWRSLSATGPWRRLDLPSAARSAAAVAAGCDPTGCLVLGRADGRLAGWTLRGASVASADVPAVALPEVWDVVAPVVASDEAWATVPDGTASLVLHQTRGAWSRVGGPDGVPIALARVGGRVYVGVRAPSGQATLWCTDAG